MKKQAKAEDAKEKALSNKRKQKLADSEGTSHKKAQKKSSLKNVPNKRRAQPKTHASKMNDDQAENHQQHDALDVSGGKCEAIAVELPCSPFQTRLKPAKHGKLSRFQKALKNKKQEMKPRRKPGATKKQGKGSHQPSGASTDASTSKTSAKRDAHGNKKKVNKSKGKEKHAPVYEYVGLITDVLKECQASHCTHPAWEPLEYDAKTFQLSVYWSRNAVGVKVAKACLPASTSQKAKGKAVKSSKSSKQKMSQVAYFANPTSCIYSNMVCAHVFVIASVFSFELYAVFLQQLCYMI